MGPQKAIKAQTKMTADNGSKLRGNTRYTYSIHVINYINVMNMRPNDVILPVLTSRYTQREQTIISFCSSLLVEVVRVYHFPKSSGKIHNYAEEVLCNRNGIV